MSTGQLRAKAIRILLLCTLFWGLSFPVMKALGLAQHGLVPAAGTWFLTFLGVLYRFGASALILGAVSHSALRTISSREIEQGIVIGIFGAGGILFQMDGLAYTQASTCAFLTQGYCVFIPLWVALNRRRWPSRKIVISTVLVVCGVWVLSRLSLNDLNLGRGEFETLIASVLLTGQILCLESPRYAGNRPENFSTVMFGVMALISLPFALATVPNAGALVRPFATPFTCALLAVLVFFSTLISYVMMNYWQKHVSATEAGLIYCIEPVVASFLCLFLPALCSQLGPPSITKMSSLPCASSSGAD